VLSSTSAVPGMAHWDWIDHWSEAPLPSDGGLPVVGRGLRPPGRFRASTIDFDQRLRLDGLASGGINLCAFSGF